MRRPSRRFDDVEPHAAADAADGMRPPPRRQLVRTPAPSPQLLRSALLTRPALRLRSRVPTQLHALARPVLPIQLPLPLLISLLAAGMPCAAQDGDAALASFARASLASTSAPVRSPPPDATAWERRLRPYDRAGPPAPGSAVTALIDAAQTGRWAAAAELLKAGAPAAAVDDSGADALVPAARAGQDDLLRLLVRRGAALDRVAGDGFTALGAAALAGRRTTVRLLLREGADPARTGASGQTALHLAALGGQADVVDELLRHGVDVDLLNRQRETALDVAAQANQQAVMARLIDAGADSADAGRR